MTRTATDRRPLILAIDVGAGAHSVAIGAAAETVVSSQRRSSAPRAEAGGLLAMIEGCLQDAGATRSAIGLVACTIGPGAFTGVRISVSVTQGLAMALGVPVCGVCSLDTLAQVAWRRHGWRRVLAALDARMGEVYWRALAIDEATGLMRPAGPARLTAPEAVSIDVTDTPPWAGAGSGWTLISAQQPGIAVPVNVDAQLQSDAVDLLAHARLRWQAGEVVDPVALEPLYLRNTVTHGER